MILVDIVYHVVLLLSCYSKINLKKTFYECLGKAINTKGKDDQKVTGDLLYITRY